VASRQIKVEKEEGKPAYLAILLEEIFAWKYKLRQNACEGIQQNMLYSNEFGNKAKGIFLENWDFFADVEFYNLTDGTVAYILGIREY